MFLEPTDDVVSLHLARPRLVSEPAYAPETTPDLGVEVTSDFGMAVTSEFGSELGGETFTMADPGLDDLEIPTFIRRQMD